MDAATSPEPPSAPAGDGDRVGPRARRYGVGLVGLAIVLGLVWWGGGFRERREDPRQIEPGQRVQGNRFALTPRDAQVTTRDPAALDPDDAEPGRYLVITLVVTNLSDATVLPDLSLNRDLHVRLFSAGGRSVPFTDEPTTYLERDRTRAAFHPGLPEAALVTMELPESVPDPARVEVTIHDERFVRSFFEERRVWFGSDKVLGRVVLPVRRA